MRKTLGKIPIGRIAEYVIGYDMIYGDYVESKYEGEAILNWILECALSDKLISKEDFDKYFVR